MTRRMLVDGTLHVLVEVDGVVLEDADPVPLFDVEDLP